MLASTARTSEPADRTISTRLRYCARCLQYRSGCTVRNSSSDLEWCCSAEGQHYVCSAGDLPKQEKCFTLRVRNEQGKFRSSRRCVTDNYPRAMSTRSPAAQLCSRSIRGSRNLERAGIPGYLRTNSNDAFKRGIRIRYSNEVDWLRRRSLSALFDCWSRAPMNLSTRTVLQRIPHTTSQRLRYNQQDEDHYTQVPEKGIVLPLWTNFNSARPGRYSVEQAGIRQCS